MEGFCVSLKSLKGLTKYFESRKEVCAEFGRILRDLRLKRGLSLSDFVRPLGVAYNTANKWENGYDFPSEKSFYELDCFLEGELGERVVAIVRDLLNEKLREVVYVGEKIRFFRLFMGLSQEEFARRVGVSELSVLKWESRARFSLMSNILKICSIFGLNFSEIGVPFSKKSDLVSWFLTSPEYFRENGSFDFICDGVRVSGPISDVLKKRRMALGLHVDDVCRMLGVSKSSVYGWECGDCNPRYESFVKICDLYKIDNIV
jgi:transcriptional regulator with XRE-family HTH domain